MCQQRVTSVNPKVRSSSPPEEKKLSQNYILALTKHSFDSSLWVPICNMCILEKPVSLFDRHSTFFTFACLEQQCMFSAIHSEYHARWCSGDFRSQSISRHGIDPTAGILRLQHRNSLNIIEKITKCFCHFRLGLLTKSYVYKTRSL